jgi:hypothetical protein
MILNSEENLARLKNYRVPEILAPDDRLSKRKFRSESDEAGAKEREIFRI